MIRQKKSERKKATGDFKVSLLFVICLIVLVGSRAFAIDVGKGGATKDVGRNGKFLSFEISNKTGLDVSDVYITIYSTNGTPEYKIPTIEKASCRGKEQGAHGDKKSCRVVFGEEMPKDSKETARLRITLSSDPPPGTEIKILLSEEYEGVHYNIIAKAPIGGNGGVLVSLPFGTYSGVTTVTNNTYRAIRSLFLSSSSNNSFTSVKAPAPFDNNRTKRFGGNIELVLNRPLLPSNSIDIYFELSNPAQDHMTSIKISDKRPETWPKPQIISPPVGFPDGTIIGCVINPGGEPVSDTEVTVSTLSGTVENINTDDDGRYKFKVPKVPVGELIGLAIVGLTEKITTKIAPPQDRDFPDEPDEFTQPGSKITFWGNYPGSEYFEETDSEPRSIPTARAISEDGRKALTTLAIPKNIMLGKGELVITDTSGIKHRFENYTYRIITARLDNRRLYSHGRTVGKYRFDFGNEMANRQVWIEIKVSGPIRIIGNGKRGALRIGPNGIASWEFTVKAKRATLGRTPFYITPVISNPK